MRLPLLRPFAPLLALLGVFAVPGFVCAEPFVLPADATVEPAITINALAGTGPSLNGSSVLDGVVRIFFDQNQDLIYGNGGDTICSGSLLMNGYSILTAGHCVDEMIALGFGAQVGFLGAATQLFTTTTALLFPGYSGVANDPRDIALLQLPAEVAGVARYDIYRGFDEVGQGVTLAGYGRSGNGTGTTGSSGTRRQVNNTIDGLWGFAPTSPFFGLTSLAYDFDNPGFAPAIDPFGTCFGVPQAGVAGEGMIAPGDSGGPLFIAGRIAGVHSWGGTNGAACGDTYGGVNSSWGEFGGDTRVSLFASWIDAHTLSDTEPVPEPVSVLLLASGLAGLAAARRRQSNAR